MCAPQQSRCAAGVGKNGGLPSETAQFDKVVFPASSRPVTAAPSSLAMIGLRRDEPDPVDLVIGKVINKDYVVDPNAYFRHGLG